MSPTPKADDLSRLRAARKRRERAVNAQRAAAKDVAAAVAALRAAGWSYGRIADAEGVTRGTVQVWERG